MRLLHSFAIAALLLVGCSAKQEPKAEVNNAPEKTYAMKGEIAGVDASGHVATIKHEKIEGFMEAMTMGYPVKDEKALSQLTVGEPITATVHVKGDDMWVGEIQKRP